MTKKEFNHLIDIEVLKGYPFSKGIKRHIRILRELIITPSHAAVYWVRKMQYYAHRDGKISSFKRQFIHMKLVRDFGMCISPNVIIGEGLRLPHPTGIVLGDATVIGKNCQIYQNVTVGGARIGDVKKRNQPIIGDEVTLFSGSMVLGAIKVADNCTIAANSVLLKDAVEAGIYVGSPARKVNYDNLS